MKPLKAALAVFVALSMTTVFVGCETFDDGEKTSVDASSTEDASTLDPSLLQNVTQLALGGEFSCALTSQGNVYCWGRNNRGQLGYVETNDNDGQLDLISGLAQVVRISDTEVLSGIVQITAGSEHACALTNTGLAYCWGNNQSGQLGNNSFVNSNFAKKVLFNSVIQFGGLKSINAGANHTCATAYLENLQYCWGSNARLQLGVPSTSVSNSTALPVRSQGTTVGSHHGGITQIAAGGVHTCAYSSALNIVYCTGGNDVGQLGDGTTTSNALARPVRGTETGGDYLPIYGTVLSIDTFSFHSCAVESESTMVRCWGWNTDRQLGYFDPNGAYYHSWSPYVRQDGQPLRGASVVSAGENFSCAIISDNTATGEVRCWGANGLFQLGFPGGGTPQGMVTENPVKVRGVNGASTLSGVLGLASGQLHSCTILSNRTVACWGGSSYRQTGRLVSDVVTDQRFTETPILVKVNR